MKSVKLVHIYDPGNPGVIEGTLLDPTHLKRLAVWLCNRTCRTTLSSAEPREQQALNGGYCDNCRDEAGFLLSECPYIDMTMPDKLMIDDRDNCSELVQSFGAH